MTDDVLPDFGPPVMSDMVLPVFDGPSLAQEAREAAARPRRRPDSGIPGLPIPEYPPAVDLGFGGPARSQMTFGENFRGAGSGVDLIGVMGEAAQMEAARGAPQPGGFQPSQLRNLPSRVRQRIEAESTPEEMAARREAAYQAVFDQAAYDLSQSRITPQSVGGTLARGLLSPENVVSLPANALRRGAAAVAGRFGAPAGRVAESAIDAAVTNTAIDPILQAGRIQSGGQEGYNPEQTALAPLVGGAAGALLRGAIEAPSFARREAQAFGVDPARIETPQPVGTEAAGVPAGAAGEARIATPEAPVAREGQTIPDAGPVQRQAEAVSPEPARIEAPAREPVDRGATVAPETLPEIRPENNIGRSEPVRVDAEPARAAANDAEPQQFAAMARNQDVDVRQTARQEIAAAAREDIAPMARQTADTTADRRFPGRQELPGEASKPRSLPENATPDEIRDFRIGVEQERLAERIGRKLEVDKRFTLRNAEGQYDFKQGVIRVRRFGDMEVFSHEFGHALEQQIRKDLGRDFDAIFTKHAAELAPLDANAKDPAQKTPREGFAEFMRMLINNPAYARRQAPNFASDLESLVSTKAPDIGQLITDAARISQIDSGMDPVQRAVAQIVPAGEPKGWAKFTAERKRYGLPDTLELWASRAYAAVVGGEGHWAAKFAANLKEAQFKKTGKPLGELYEADPYKRFRMLPGAEQSASDAFFNGVRRYGRGGQFEDPVSPSLHAALVDAGEGSATRVTNNPEEVRLFDAYLMARRASALYERWRAGDIKNPPVNMTEAEVQAAITSIEAMRPGYKAGADKVFAFSRAHWNRIHDAGIVPTNIWQAVVARGEDYVPLAREMNEGGSTRGSGSTGERGADIKRLQGSSREVKGPLQSLMRDVVQYERIIAENEMRLSFVRLAESGGEFAGRFIERVPNTELKAQTSDIAELIRQKVRQAGGDQTEAEVAIRTLEDMVGDDLTATVFRATETRPGNERIWFTWEGGERTAWKIGNDPWSANFYDAMVQMNAAERDMLNDMLGTANAFFSQMITQAPQFALGNLIADGMTRPFVAKHTGLLGRIPLTGMARGIYNHIAAREITKATAEVAPLSAMPGIQTVQSALGYEREFARRYDAVGGIRGGPSTALLRELEDSGARALTLAPKGFKEATADIASLVQQGRGGAVVSEVAKKWVRFMDSTETMGRVGQMAMTYNHLRKMGIDEASATFESAFQARDLLDYDRRGTLMRGWRKSLPFINPGIQGTDLGIRRAFGEPFIAAVQAYKRGGWDNLDLEQKNNLKNAVQVWGVLAAAVVFQVAYTLKMWEDPIYRRSSDWMRSQYWIFPLTEGASRDGSDDRAVTIRRPFDFAGAMLKATEAATLGIVRADPEGAKRVAHQLVDGFVPRQFQGLDNLAASSPFIRLLYEVPLGRQMGFDGGPPRDIIPQNLQKLSPRDQYTPHTSWVARQWGELTGKSPMMFDHVVQTMLATTGRDLSDAATGLSGQNANMTSADAFTKMFVGNVYRRQRGIGQAARDLTALMSGDHSKYGARANSYAENRLSDPDRARTAFNAADDIGKSLMVLRAHAFTPADRQFHPLERGDAFLKLINTATRDLAWGEMTIQDRSRVRGQQRETIEMTPADSRALVNVLNAWGWEEINNSLVVSGVPAYRNYNLIDTSARLQMIRSLHPRVADEIEARMTRLHIKPLEEVRRNWPEVQRRLITDQSAARLDDLHSGAAVRASARRARTRQRVEESNNSD